MGIDVRVPATVANLGPGFDCLGVAVGLHLELRITHADKAETVGGDPSIPVEDDLTHRAFVSAYAAVGEQAPPVRIEGLGAYPPGRGLGASAPAIVAGRVGAAAALMMATGDRLREPYRLPLLPETLDLHQGLRAKGVAAALSGAGPSVVCLSASDAIEDEVALARTLLAPGWEVIVPGWDL